MSTGRETLYNLFSKMAIEMIPTKRGSNGVANRICVDASMSSMAHFVNNFELVPRRVFLVTYTPKSYPYTGATYKQYVWEFKEMELVKRFLSCFANFKPSWQVMWVRNFHQPGIFVRVDNPAESESKFLLETDEESKKQRDQYYQEHLNSVFTNTQMLSMVVGEVGKNKKRISSFKLVYTLNQDNNVRIFSEGESHIAVGQLKLSFNYEVFNGGISKGGKVGGESKEGGGSKAKERAECIKSVVEITSIPDN